MAAEYYWIMTTVGLAKRAAAEAGGTAIDMRTGKFVVGDGNGAYSDPTPAQVALVHERWRGTLNRVYVSPTDATLMVCEALIPINVGGFYIREAGILDAAGDLIAVGKYPLVTKPDPSSGAARAEYVRGGFRISNGGATVLQINNSVVMATQEELNNHAALTNPHQATNLATANRLVLRDDNGRACIAPPLDPEHIARLGDVTAHAQLQNPHSATPSKSPNRLILRDNEGRAKVTSPLASDDIATRGFVTYANLPDKPDFTLMINQAIYRVGSYFVNHDDNRNPAVILGFGTWLAVEGRFILGVSADFPVNTMGGEAKHALTNLEMPNHDHPLDKVLTWPARAGLPKVAEQNQSPANPDDYSAYQPSTGSTGGGQPHENMPPYETAYIWRRTA